MDQGVPAVDPVSSSAPPSPPPLPPPSPPFAPFGEVETWVRPPRVAGQLVPAWRLIFGLGWGVVIACQAALWETSRVVGLSTWWLGADAQPRLLLLQLLPFYGPILVMVAAIANWKYSPFLGIAAAAAGAAIGAGDLGRVRWIAVVELVLAGGALCISAASLAGMYRDPKPMTATG